MKSTTNAARQISLEATDRKLVKLHLGCGLNAVESWINLDGSWNALMVRYGLRRWLGFFGLLPASIAKVNWSRSIRYQDLRKPLRFSTSTCDVIYSAHVLEHLFFEEQKALLKECFRVLRPGGMIRIVVPDLEAIVGDYLNDLKNWKGQKDGTPPAFVFNKRYHAHNPAPPRGPWIYRVYKNFRNFNVHRWMHDKNSLEACLREAGFINVRALGGFESGIANIEEVERELTSGKGSIHLEATKP